MANNVTFGVGAKGVAKTSSDLDNLRDKFAKMQKQGAKGVGLGIAAGATTFALGALSQAVGEVTAVIGDSIKAAIADEESQNRLRASLTANVPAWDGNTKAIERNILAKQRLGFEDETLRDSLTILVGATHDVAEAQRVQAIAMDLARFKGVDLKTASEALIKVEGGVYRSLKSLGIVLRDGATQTEALAAVQKVAAGQAEAYANTLSGKLLAAQIRFNEQLENAGTKALPLIATGLEEVLFALDKTSDGWDGFTRRVKEGNRGAIATMQMLEHAADETGVPVQRLFELAQEQGLDLASMRVKDWAEAISDAGDEASTAIEKLRDRAGTDLRKTGNAFERVGDRADALGRAIVKANLAAGASWDEFVKKLGDDADSLIDDAFDPIIAHDRLMAANAEIAAARRVLASGTASKAERRDARETLHSAGKDQAELLVTLAEAGAIGSKAFTTGIADLRNEIKNATGPTKVYLQGVLDKILAIERAGKTIPLNFKVTGPGNASWLLGRRAEGGPAKKGMPYIVGEKRPELFVPSTNGTIVPRVPSLSSPGGSGIGGGGDVHYHVTVNAGIGSGLTAGDGRALAEQIGPALYADMQRRGMLPRTTGLHG